MCLELTNANCCETAMILAADGMPVVLCDGRKPIREDWWHHRYSVNEIERAFHTNSYLNVGLVLGDRSDLIEVSGDTPQSHYDMCELFDGWSALTPTLESRRRIHLLFNFDERLASLDKPWLRYRSLDIGVGGGGRPVLCVLPPSSTDGFCRGWHLPMDEWASLDLPEIVVKKIVRANLDYAESKSVAARAKFGSGRLQGAAYAAL